MNFVLSLPITRGVNFYFMKKAKCAKHEMETTISFICKLIFHALLRHYKENLPLDIFQWEIVLSAIQEFSPTPRQIAETCA